MPLCPFAMYGQASAHQPGHFAKTVQTLGGIRKALKDTSAAAADQEKTVEQLDPLSAKSHPCSIAARYKRSGRPKWLIRGLYYDGITSTCGNQGRWRNSQRGTAGVIDDVWEIS